MQNPPITFFKSNAIRIIPFGGCGEFGMNMTGYICDDRLYLVDAGVSFPDPSKLGVESLFPDMAPWIEQFGGVYAYIITHGHEDHIGALPFMLERWPGPVYTTPWTAALIDSKLQRRGIGVRYPIHRVMPGDRIECEDFSLEFVPFNHSIPNACGLMIRSGTFNIFHTGDFKFDFTPVLEPPVNISHLEKLGKEGIHVLLADSTNAHIPGFCPSESSVFEPMRKAFEQAGTGAVVVTTFSSNFFRLKTILDACESSGRKALILGGGLDNCIKIASELGLFQPTPGLIIDSSVALNIDRSKLCVIATGSQGEWRSALMRMANGEHRQFTICPGDLVVFSSRTIPGNERIVQYMMSLLERRGAKIFSVRNDPQIHVSGHAYREELKQLIAALRPKNFVPVHGTFSHLTSNSKIPAEVGLTSTRTYVIENGDVIDIDAKDVTISDRIDIDNLFVDSGSMELLPYEVLRERLRIGELGLVIVSACCDLAEIEILGETKITVQGLVPTNGSSNEEFEQTIKKAAFKGFKHAKTTRETSPEQIEEHMRVEVRRHLFQSLRKKPVVICNIIAV
jgi:ribonuclease J